MVGIQISFLLGWIPVCWDVFFFHRMTAGHRSVDVVAAQQKEMVLPMVVGLGWLIDWWVSWFGCLVGCLKRFQVYYGVWALQKVRFFEVVDFVEQKWRLGKGQCSSRCTWWVPVALGMSFEFETQSNQFDSVLKFVARTRPITVVTPKCLHVFSLQCYTFRKSNKHVFINICIYIYIWIW